ncbi:MAG TPA: histidine ammonia-lyase [Chloroflexota bacterium]|nr:histidine ammonia-lyase [Chloroflexota bacterium]
MRDADQLPLTIDCQPLSITEVVAAAREGRRVELGSNAVAAIGRSREVIDRVVASREIVYGVTTGFGRLADRVIPPDDLERLQRNLIMSHSVGVGAPLDADVTRAMTLLRISALARGYSGIRLETVQALIDMLNAGVVPFVPRKGSVGASGDLAPLAHLALVLIGQGHAWVDGELVTGQVALRRRGLRPVELTAKEGLALINGTQLMTAMGCLLCEDGCNVMEVADIAGAMTVDAVRGSARPFDARVQEIRPHPGQVAAAAHLRALLSGSEIVRSHQHDMRHKVQDPYSLRCMPQVHGASRATLSHCRDVMEVEINSVTDNPLVFPEDGSIISGGNFHGEPLAMAMDYLAIGLAELADISERRIEVMLDPSFSELPPFLTMHGGVESGFMVSQYTAAALISENRVLAHPASVDSVPTSANQEDHVSMGVTSALKAEQILRNVESVLAIELLAAAEGIDFRRPLRTSPALEAVHALIRSKVPHVAEDRVLYPDIEIVTEMIRTRQIARAAAGTGG